MHQSSLPTIFFIVKLKHNIKLKEIQMNPAVSTKIVLLLAALSVAGCSSAPEMKEDPYNQADSQRSRAQQAQDELSSETSSEK